MSLLTKLPFELQDLFLDRIYRLYKFFVRLARWVFQAFIIKGSTYIRPIFMILFPKALFRA